MSKTNADAQVVVLTILFLYDLNNNLEILSQNARNKLMLDRIYPTYTNRDYQDTRQCYICRQFIIIFQRM